MIFPTPQRAAWTPEESYLMEMHADQIRALLFPGSHFALRRADGTWFTVVSNGVRALRGVEFNLKEKKS